MTTRFHHRKSVPQRKASLDNNLDEEWPERGNRHSHFRNDFESRQREWEDEVDRFRRDFFRNTPFERSVRGEPRLRLFSEGRHFSVPETRIKLPEHEVATNQVPHPDHYCVEFELADFEPEDIYVKVEDMRLTVTAKRKTNGSMREITKTVEVPNHVDPEKLISRFSPEGLLTVETLQPPCYESVKHCTSVSSNDAEESP